MPDLFTFENDSLPSSIRVLSFQGHEAISRPYRYEINLSATHGESQEIDLDAVVNKPARLNIHRADGTAASTVHGVIASFESLHEYADGGLFRAVLVPRLWTLGLNEHSRVFVNDDLPTIIRAVLKAGGLSTADYELQLSARYRPIEHVCQYQESYLDFLSRWLEREGLFYFFKQEDGGEKLVIADDKSVHVDSPRHAPVSYFPRVGDEDMSVEAFESFVCRRQVLPGSVAVKDYNYLQPTTALEGSARVETSSTNEVVRFGDNALTSADCKRLAGFRAQELLSRQSVFHASGPVYGLETGFVFQVEDHPRSAYNTSYVATAITHTGQQFAGHAAFRALLGIDPNSTDTYKVDVEAILRTVQFRAPAVTPWPRIFGIEPATIDGDADHDYAQLDDHGRYKVKIKFDEGDLINGRASTRIRMIQPHGGNPEGFHFPLRKHTEVLLVFLGGDPDRPSIMGVGPDSDHPSPVTAGNHTLNVLQTGGENRMEIQDLAGQQYVKWKTPHANTLFHIGAPHGPPTEIYAMTDGTLQFDLKTHNYINVGQNNRIVVKGNSTHETTGNHLHTIKGNATEETTGNHHKTVTGNQTCKVTAKSDYTHVGPYRETLDSTETRVITGESKTHHKGPVVKILDENEVTETYGNTTETTYGIKKETIIGGSSETVIGAKQEILLGGSSELSLALTTSIQVGGKDEIFVGASSDIAVGGIMEVKGPWVMESTIVHLKTGGFKLETEACHVEEKATKVEEGATHVKQQATVINVVAIFLVA